MKRLINDWIDYDMEGMIDDSDWFDYVMEGMIDDSDWI